ncbi:MAG TPA: ubiquitin-like protein Pup [Nitrospiria bacterium]
MSKQERKADRKKEPVRKEEEAASTAKAPDKGKKIKENIDKVMDQIDDVLEKNAEEFVKNYVQKGGQ